MSKRSEQEQKAKAYYDNNCICCSLSIVVETFLAGYEQAEEDLALTIEDLELIHTFLYAVKNNKHGAFTFTLLSDEQYQEVLNRFNKSKEVRK